ncbi:hypothetical protein halTADL_0917 [Halohasta litchfieldiae]|jgi:hypothetical protein|uniref:Uncharacterized protein n=1 Tax=Halohasta litchfieldiae TaxID=1073996 RepID=A0A1H6T648_9EURY|nr:hypothetical protein [Halohasta litchfieldiae]ATW87713.1 hypothetical protein halTADL_0917 [Halohasta litchfieldiae]SEI75498.1 hypothetical protein SAMN05444271_10764 [Halohasta litchfieldiae]
MIESVTRFTVFALYQLTVMFGILLLPVAFAARRLGIQLPIGDLIERLDSAYAQTAN